MLPPCKPLLGGPAVAILDCRFDLAAPEAGRRAYLAAHIPRRALRGLERDLSGPVDREAAAIRCRAARALAARFGALGVGDDTQVIAYDEANGAFAARAWWLLRWLGHTRVAVLDGGLRPGSPPAAALDPASPRRRRRPAACARDDA